MMYHTLYTLAILTIMNTQTIFDFNTHSDISEWRIVDDVVMGGESSGMFRLNEEGLGVFQGNVSLENNGGFSSVRYSFETMKVEEGSKMIIRLKGDGKNYQIRVKNNRNNYYSYIITIATTGEWQNVEIPLSEMYPSFRGRKLDLPLFKHETLEEFAILIANKKAENFKLLIDKIEVE